MKLDFLELKNAICSLAKYNEDTFMYEAIGDIVLCGKSAWVDATYVYADMSDLDLYDLYTRDEELYNAIEDAMVKQPDGCYAIDVQMIINAK